MLMTLCEKALMSNTCNVDDTSQNHTDCNFHTEDVEGSTMQGASTLRKELTKQCQQCQLCTAGTKYRINESRYSQKKNKV